MMFNPALDGVQDKEGAENSLSRAAPAKTGAAIYEIE